MVVGAGDVGCWLLVMAMLVMLVMAMLVVAGDVGAGDGDACDVGDCDVGQFGKFNVGHTHNAFGLQLGTVASALRLAFACSLRMIACASCVSVCLSLCLSLCLSVCLSKSINDQVDVSGPRAAFVEPVWGLPARHLAETKH